VRKPPGAGQQKLEREEMGSRELHRNANFILSGKRKEKSKQGKGGGLRDSPVCIKEARCVKVKDLFYQHDKFQERGK